MTERILSFYESFADYYHLIFDDWNEAIERQAKILNPLLAAQMHGHPLKILDYACGIGTQALGLAGFGHQVTASELTQSPKDRYRADVAASIQLIQSVLRACIGSIEAARRAGINAATVAQVASSRIAPRNASGS
jgi:SAM-dependent methyltransferase